MTMKLSLAVRRFLKDDRGMETVEWAILAALIVAGLIGIVAGVGGNVKSAFTNLQSATTPTP
jgi:Flp pilus assembly pilin Flp